MRVPGLKKVRLSARWLRSRFVKGALILGYHRIADDNDPYSLCVQPKHFEEQLALLRRVTQPISLNALLEGLKTDSLPPRAVVLTFDDGYADNLHQALPLLVHYEVPATFFVATGYLGRPFWWDELAHLLLGAPHRPRRLSVEVADRTHVWSADNGDGTGSLDLLQLIYRCLLGLPLEERQLAMDQLCEQVGMIPGETSHLPKALTPEELGRLAESGLANIGTHTVTHPILTALSVESQRWEIAQSKQEIEELIGKPVTAFSFPNGVADDASRSLLVESSYIGGCTSFNDIVRLNSDPYYLPRFWIPNWNRETFGHWLMRWLVG